MHTIKGIKRKVEVEVKLELLFSSYLQTLTHREDRSLVLEIDYYNLLRHEQIEAGYMQYADVSVITDAVQSALRSLGYSKAEVAVERITENNLDVVTISIDTKGSCEV